MLAGEKSDLRLETLQSRGYRQAPLERPVPIYLAALRSRMCEMAAEVGDGVIFNLWPKRALPRMIEHVRIGAERAGKDPAEVEVVNRYMVLVTDDKAAALARFKRLMAPYYATPVYNAFLAWAGYEDVAATIAEGWAARDPRQDDGRHFRCAGERHRRHRHRRRVPRPHPLGRRHRHPHPHRRPPERRRDRHRAHLRGLHARKLSALRGGGPRPPHVGPGPLGRSGGEGRDSTKAAAAVSAAACTASTTGPTPMASDMPNTAAIDATPTIFVRRPMAPWRRQSSISGPNVRWE